jgi:urease accessory protein
MNDALFPLGTFTHSWGLETYIQKNLVRDVAEAEEWLRCWLEENFLYGDLLCASLAWKLGAERNCAGIMELENISRASKGPLELREAACKIGSRFVKNMGFLLPAAGLGDPFLAEFAAKLKAGGASPSHACAYGAYCGCLGLDRGESMEAFLYAQVSSMITCCVKTVPLSQTGGQTLLAGLFGLMEKLLEGLETLGEDALYRSCPGFDIRAMQHETLYSRLYMS